MSSFTTGVDFIQHIVDNFRDQHPTGLYLGGTSVHLQSLQTNINSELNEIWVSIEECLANIRNTNAFMLMTVNRCIDYTKASKGLKLVPRYETIDVYDTLHLPLDCMRNIQQRIHIQLNPIDSVICSYLITDRQWLQENLLCLLSNAVKYSTGGTVTISVFLADEADFQGMKGGSGSRKSSKAAVPSSNTTTATKQAGKNILQSGQSHQTKAGSVAGVPSSKSHVHRLPNAIRSPPSEDTSHTGNSLWNTVLRYFSRQSTAKVAAVNERSIFSFASGGSSLAWRGSRESSISRVFATNDLGLSRSQVGFNENSSDIGNEIQDEVSNKYIRFEIEDTGIGMTEEAMASLFNPFKQTQRLAGGTGLGLYSLAKRLEALHGFYGVMKRRDGKQGSLFWFAIPYRPDHVAALLIGDNDKDQLFGDSVEQAYKRAKKRRRGMGKSSLDATGNHDHGREKLPSHLEASDDASTNSAFRGVENKNKISLMQSPTGKYTSSSFHVCQLMTSCYRR